MKIEDFPLKGKPTTNSGIHVLMFCAWVVLMIVFFAPTIIVTASVGLFYLARSIGRDLRKEWRRP